MFQQRVLLSIIVQSWTIQFKILNYTSVTDVYRSYGLFMLVLFFLFLLRPRYILYHIFYMIGWCDWLKSSDVTVHLTVLSFFHWFRARYVRGVRQIHPRRPGRPNQVYASLLKSILGSPPLGCWRVPRLHFLGAKSTSKIKYKKNVICAGT